MRRGRVARRAAAEVTSRIQKRGTSVFQVAINDT
jgi:hypothetical protein